MTKKRKLFDPLMARLGARAKARQRKRTLRTHLIKVKPAPREPFTGEDPAQPFRICWTQRA